MNLQVAEAVKAPFDLWTKFTELSIEYGPKLLGAIIVYIIGSFSPS